MEMHTKSLNIKSNRIQITKLYSHMSQREQGKEKGERERGEEKDDNIEREMVTP